MDNFIHIETITQLHDAFKSGKPQHPLITVFNLSDVAISPDMLHKKIRNNFYSITLKTQTHLSFKYGREYFDFAEGFLFGLAPNQIIEVDETAKKGDMKGWSLYFHPDLIRSSPLMEKITDYGFFSYQTNEALHVSEKEKQVINDIIEKIIDEYSSNIDDFSQDVLVSNIELLFNYIKRFYSRQFITRKQKNTSILSKFKKLLREYYVLNIVENKGLPTVKYFANRLHLSDSYLSDLLKKETGKSAQENIHLFIIEQAKNELINTNKSVSEIAFELGFDYPQYFSRLFKNKTGNTPKEYRMNLN